MIDQCKWCGAEVMLSTAWRTDRQFITINYLPGSDEPKADSVIKERLWFCSHSHRNEYLYGV